MFDVLIVGAGPAGLAAAQVAARAGLRVGVVDEQAAAGGQVFRAPRAGGKRSFGSYPWGRQLLDDTTREPITWFFGHSALGVLRDDDSAIRLVIRPQGGAVEVLGCRRLLIATGSYDLPVAFPGWTLPGVIGAGAAQTLLKGQSALVDDPVVLAGGHPLVLVVARDLLRAGVRIRALALTQRMRELFTGELLAAGLGNGRIVRDAVTAMATLAEHRVPVLAGTVVSRALGPAGVERVELSPIGGDRGKVREVEAGSLLLGYGLAPSTDLARQVGCALDWRPAAGGWVVRHDADQRTTVPEVYAAGEPTGVGGADLSRAEGLVAGRAMVTDLTGAVAPEPERVRVDRMLRSSLRFANRIRTAFALPEHLLADAPGRDTPVCRCEGVTRAAVEDFVDELPGPVSPNAVKLACRVGMGVCQGRYCERTVLELLRQKQGAVPSDHWSGQFPVRPTPLEQLIPIASRSSGATKHAGPPPDDG
ncbi:NAD(P)/FAD-dependent oxidoreductase [Enemella sp. A6]|uniref:FAD/NAD(P)-dependent oxidoreductase n=1 Tax=Enemella sp. A6 TaxID=3440152 RepID=UPI003EBAC3CA